MASSAFRVVGQVVGKPRPRFNRIGAHVRTYTPNNGERFEELVRNSYMAQCGDMHKGSVNVEIAYRRALPKSRPKKVESEPDLFKPDVDNVAKAVLDALNGVAFEDDKDVVSLKVEKLPRVRMNQDELYVIVSDAYDEEMKEEWLRFTNSTRR